MEKEDKIFEQFKLAAENAETKEFPAMDKVWSRVEGKLDNKKDKKAMLLWKKIAVAASLLLVTTLGYQFFKSNQTQIKPNETIVSIDSTKVKTPNANPDVSIEPTNPAINKNALQILTNQIKPETQVVMEYTKGTYPTLSTDSLTITQTAWGSLSTPVKGNSNALVETQKAKEVELFMDKQGKVSNEQKEEPLVVINNKHEKKSIRELEFDEADSLVVLKEPLYIINGVEYTEQEVFGPNPTSPYTPLNKQEIETFSILQNEKAIEIYGTKGKKGVVIITTKNGKPALKKTK